MRNNKFKKSCLACAFVVCGGSAVAQERYDAAAMTRLHAETEVLRAQIAREEAAQALKAMREANKKPEPPPPPPPKAAWKPQVKAVEGVGIDRVAVLIMENGGTMEARVGDDLPDGSRMHGILPNKVTRTVRGVQEVLPFASGDVASQ